MPDRDTDHAEPGFAEGPQPLDSPDDRDSPPAPTSRDRVARQVREINHLAQDLLDYLRYDLGESRELSIACTHIETATMWAVRHCTR